MVEVYKMLKGFEGTDEVKKSEDDGNDKRT